MGHTKIILWPTQIVSSGPQVARGPQVASVSFNIICVTLADVEMYSEPEIWSNVDEWSDWLPDETCYCILILFN